MNLFEDDYNGEIPIVRVRRLKEEWVGLISVNMEKMSGVLQNNMLGSKGDLIAWPSREGLTGLEDAKAALQVYNEILPRIFVTPHMYYQVVPRFVDYVIPSFDDEDMVEYIEEDPKEDLEEDPEEDPKGDNRAIIIRFLLLFYKFSKGAFTSIHLITIMTSFWIIL